MNTTTYVIKGINSDADTCAACGKTHLKRVVWLAALDVDGVECDAAPYGSDCAGQLVRGAKTRANGEVVAKHAAAIELARKWVTAGHNAEVVSKAVWQRTGLSIIDVRDGFLGYWADRQFVPMLAV